MLRLVSIAIVVLLGRLDIHAENVDHLTPLRGAIFEHSDSPAYWLSVHRTLIASRPEPGKAIVRVFMPALEVYREGDYSGESLFTLYFVGDWELRKGSYLLEFRLAEKSLAGLKDNKTVPIKLDQMPIDKELGLRIQRIWQKYLLETRYPKRLVMQYRQSSLHSCVMPDGDTYCGATPNGYLQSSKMYHLDLAPFNGAIWLHKGAANLESKARFLDTLDQLEK